MEVVYSLVVLGWPLLMVVAMLLTGDLELPERTEEWLEDRRWERWEREKLAAERVPAEEDYTTGVVVSERGWAADLGIRLTGGRWWRPGVRGSPSMLVVEQGDFVFEPHWCVHEIRELEPLLVAAFPKTVVATIQDLLGDAVQPRYSWQPRRPAVDYPWKPVPAYVDRALGATAAWVGRQRVGARL